MILFSEPTNSSEMVRDGHSMTQEISRKSLTGGPARVGVVALSG